MFTQSAKQSVMRAIFMSSAISGDNGFTMGLSTTTPTKDGGGANISEPAAASGYQRTPVSYNDFTVDEHGVLTNKDVISFSAFVQSVGIVTHYVLFDSDGRAVWFDELEQHKNATADRYIYFPVGSLKIRLHDEDGEAGRHE